MNLGSAPTVRTGRCERDRGGLSIFAVITTFTVLVFFGAIVDFSQKLQARHDANVLAEEAARAGATQVDRDRAYTDGTFVVDQAAAIRAAQTYLRASGHAGTVSPQGPRAIKVQVHLARPAIFLTLIGIDRLDVDAAAVADLASGTTGEAQ